MPAPLNAPAVATEPEAELNVVQLEDAICQLLADCLLLHKKVPNGELVVNLQNGLFSYTRLTIGRKPQVIYPSVS